MSVTTWDTVPALNNTIGGLDISEGCPPGNLNNMGRHIMAGVAELRDTIPNTDGFATKDAAVFEGTQPRYTGRGALLHHNDNANASGRVYVLPEGSTAPTLGNGDIVFFYT